MLTRDELSAARDRTAAVLAASGIVLTPLLAAALDGDGDGAYRRNRASLLALLGS